MKKFTCMLLCLAMLLTLCACGGGKTDGTSNSVQNSNGADQPGNVLTDPSTPSEDTPDNEYTLYEYLTSGETIWYAFGKDQGKDSFVKMIYVFELNGSMYSLLLPEMTLGELEQMEDAEIAEMVKSSYMNVTVETSDSVRELLVSCFGYLLEGDTYTDIIDTIKAHNSGSTLRTELYWEVIDPILEEELDNLSNLRQTWKDIFTTVYNKLESMEWWKHPVYHNYGDNPALTWSRWVLGDIGGNDYEAESSTDFNRFLNELVSYGILTEEEVAESQHLRKEINAVSVRVTDKFNAVLSENREPGQYKLIIESDSTGNNTATMVIICKHETMLAVTFDYIELTYQYPAGINHGNATTVVYDSVYGGYGCNDYVWGSNFYTRANENAHFMLDTLGTYDILVDPSLEVWDYWDIFDIKISLEDYWNSN